MPLFHILILHLIFYHKKNVESIFETTNNILNFTIYKNVSSKSLLYWVRVIVANRLAPSAEEWTKIFEKENSGTYNNQFVILDLNKIDLKKKSQLPEKTLMIIEQIPGQTFVNDVTEIEINIMVHIISLSQKIYIINLFLITIIIILIVLMIHLIIGSALGHK